MSRPRPVTALLLSLLVPPAWADGSEQITCVDVRIGEDRSSYWQCLTEMLAQKVEAEKNRQSHAAAALAATVPSGPTALNLFDEAATSQRLGSAFGHSVYPERPVETFRNPWEIKH